MPTHLTQLFEPGKTPLPVTWHDSAWRPRVTIRRGYHRRLSLNRLQISARLEHRLPVTHHALRLTPHPSPVISRSPSSTNHHPSSSPAPWPPRTFIFSRLPSYPLARLVKLVSL